MLLVFTTEQRLHDTIVEGKACFCLSFLGGSRRSLGKSLSFWLSYSMTRFAVVMFFARKTPLVALPFLIKINKKNWSKRCRIPLVLLNCTMQEILLRLIRKPYYTRLALATRPITKSKGTFLTQLIFVFHGTQWFTTFSKEILQTHFAPEIHWLCV